LGEALLSVEGLRTYFYTSRGIVRAVDDVCVEVDKGEVVGLVGESGCGKSCTALSIMRLVPPPGRIVGGTVLLRGKNLLTLSEKEMRSVRGKEVSMVFQDPFTFLNPLIKVGNQIAESIMLHQKVEARQVRERVIEALDMVRLPSPERVARLYPHELSGGMRQRAMIAMAISSSPSLLIADEPTTALDVTVQAQILQLLKELTLRLSISLMLITHDLGIVAEACDRLCVMYGGKIVETGSVFEAFGDPKHPYTRGLLQSAFSVEEFKKELRTIPGSVPDLTDPPKGCRFHPRCPSRKEVCCTEEPPLFEAASKHRVACWLYG